MKQMMIVLALAVLVLSACLYEAPFTTEHSIAIDAAVLGLWEPEENAPEDEETLMILKYSDTEYLIHSFDAKDSQGYFRGYPIKIGEISCVQLQIIGDENGPPRNDITGLFSAISLELTDRGLEIKSLNSELVHPELKTTEELRAAFLTHTGNKDLFKDPAVFRKRTQAMTERVVQEQQEREAF
jgi:hypothetical protein